MKRFKLLQFIGPGQCVPAWCAMAISGGIVIGAFAGLIARLATASKSEALVFVAAILASATAAFCSAFWIASNAKCTMINADACDQRGGKR